MRIEVRIAGFGGQGIVTAGILLGEAAVLIEGKNAVQTQSYGPEARGGASRSEVIISDESIDYPRVVKPDILIAMSQEAYDKYKDDLKANGILIIDEDLVRVQADERVIRVPATRAAEELGNRLAANVVMLGALAQISRVVHPNSLRRVIKDRWPKHAELNLKAFDKGMELAKVELNLR